MRHEKLDRAATELNSAWQSKPRNQNRHLAMGMLPVPTDLELTAWKCSQRCQHFSRRNGNNCHQLLFPPSNSVKELLAPHPSNIEHKEFNGREGSPFPAFNAATCPAQ
ncbi:MAG: hypothetical protein V4443_04385 [Pseudomonadota bacterium]